MLSPIMSFNVRHARKADAGAISALVQSVFAAYVAADWSPDAGHAFTQACTPACFVERLADAAFAAVAEADERVVGFILLPTPDLLGFLFVDGSCHRQGIGKALWRAALAHLQMAYPATHTVSLNATPHAVAAYRALGFVAISEPFERGGCVATRMACGLPGQRHNAVHDTA